MTCPTWRLLLLAKRHLAVLEEWLRPIRATKAAAGPCLENFEGQRLLAVTWRDEKLVAGRGGLYRARRTGGRGGA